MREHIYKEKIVHKELSTYHLISDNYPFPCHWHNEFELIHLQQGQCSISIENQTYHLMPGEYLLVNPGELHCAHCTNGKTCILNAFVFRLDDVHDLFENQNPDPELCHKISALNSDGNIDLYYFKSLIYALFYKMKYNNQIKTNEAVSINAASIKKVLQYMNENYYQPLTIDELAAVSDFSKSHFIREFKKQTGITPVFYLNQVRLETAKKLLFSEGNVTDIAYKVGFNNSSYFIKKFKSFYGISPKQYIKQRQMAP